MWGPCPTNTSAPASIPVPRHRHDKVGDVLGIAVAILPLMGMDGHHHQVGLSSSLGDPAGDVLQVTLLRTRADPRRVALNVVLVQEPVGVRLLLRYPFAGAARRRVRPQGLVDVLDGCQASRVQYILRLVAHGAYARPPSHVRTAGCRLGALTEGGRTGYESHTSGRAVEVAGAAGLTKRQAGARIYQVPRLQGVHGVDQPLVAVVHRVGCWPRCTG